MQMDRKIEFFKSLCIRDLLLSNVQINIANFLYPACLTTVNIGREVHPDNILSILNFCPNLKEIQMVSMIKHAMHSEDFLSDHCHFPKLHTLTLLLDPSASLTESSQGALNFLLMLPHLKATNLKRFYMDTFISDYSSSIRTMEVLLLFLYYHRNTIASMVIGVNHVQHAEPSPSEVRQMKELTQNRIEPLFQNTQLEQKFITFSNIKDVEFSSLYPFLCAQSQLEKLTVTNWNGSTQNWILFRPIFDRNCNTLKKLHLSLECLAPFDFRILKDCKVLLELALFVNTTRANPALVNGVNLFGLPRNLELLILSNILLRTEEMDFIPNQMHKLKILALVQIGGMPSLTNGMRLQTAQKLLHSRTLEAILLCGICTPSIAEKTSLRRMSSALTGREDFYIMTGPIDPPHRYWTITRQENAFTANLSFHLQIRY